MKKIKNITLLLLALALLLAGCNNNPTPTPTPTPEEDDDDNKHLVVSIVNANGDEVESAYFRFENEATMNLLAGEEYSFKVYKQDIFGEKEEVTASAKFMLDGVEWSNEKFTPLRKSSHNFIVQVNDKRVSCNLKSFAKYEIFDCTISDTYLVNTSLEKSSLSFKYFDYDGTLRSFTAYTGLREGSMPNNLQIKVHNYYTPDPSDPDSITIDIKSLIEDGKFTENKITEDSIKLAVQISSDSDITYGATADIMVYEYNECFKKLSQNSKTISANTTVKDVLNRCAVFFYTDAECKSINRIPTITHKLITDDGSLLGGYTCDKDLNYEIPSSEKDYKITISSTYYDEDLTFTVNPTN